MPTNGEIIRTSYTAFARGDVDGALTAFAPDIEWTHPGGLDAGGNAVNLCDPAFTAGGAIDQYFSGGAAFVVTMGGTEIRGSEAEEPPPPPKRKRKAASEDEEPGAGGGGEGENE